MHQSDKISFLNSAGNITDGLLVFHLFSTENKPTTTGWIALKFNLGISDLQRTIPSGIW